MVVNGRPLKRMKRRVTADLHDFLTFPSSPSSSSSSVDGKDGLSCGPFRTRVREFLTRNALLPPPSSLFPHLLTWQMMFRVGDLTDGPDSLPEAVCLDVVEEDVTRSRSVYCDQCRVVGESTLRLFPDFYFSISFQYLGLALVLSEYITWFRNRRHCARLFFLWLGKLLDHTRAQWACEADSTLFGDGNRTRFYHSFSRESIAAAIEMRFFVDAIGSGWSSWYNKTINGGALTERDMTSFVIGCLSLAIAFALHMALDGTGCRRYCVAAVIIWLLFLSSSVIVTYQNTHPFFFLNAQNTHLVFIILSVLQLVWGY